MLLYDGYCYASPQDLLAAFASNPLWYSSLYPDQPSFSLLGNNVEMLTAANRFIIYTPPSCSEVGVQDSYFGLTVGDAVELGWLCFGAVIAAYCVKLLQRAL